MVQLTPQSRIFLATEPVDFRKGIDGLAAVWDLQKGSCDVTRYEPHRTGKVRMATSYSSATSDKASSR